MKTKIQIKSVWGSILFEHESENNSVKETIIEALKSYTNLRAANLYGADLRGADLRGADLRGADLRGADLRAADLRDADLRAADLCGADLRGANLSGADLRAADLRAANLYAANLCAANLYGADLRGADLSSAKHDEGTAFLLSQCPSEGSFIAWKRASGYIVKLRITENAKRSSATTLQCRCSEAEVLGIENIDGSDSGVQEVRSNKDWDFFYKVGEIISVPDFDENRFNECSSGIHFFIAREMAVNI